jgi:Zn-dependent protease
MMGKPIVLFRLLGFKIQADVSWLFLAVLVTWSLALGLFPVRYPDLPMSTYWSMGVAGAIGLFASLIFHELAHALVARTYGIPIKGITLFLFGGVAEMSEEPKYASVEFLMAIAGPISSFILSLGFYLLGLVTTVSGFPDPVVGVLRYLAFINLLLGAFNLVPAFPMDGGRVLRAALWHFKGDLRQATKTAAQCGRGCGMILMVLGVYNVITGQFVVGMWWFLIGLFVRGAAATSYQQVLARGIFSGEPVARFMTRNPVTVSPTLPIQSFVDDYVYKYHHSVFPVVTDGRLVSYVLSRNVKSVSRQDWARRRVSEIATPCEADIVIEPTTDTVTAMSVMNRTGQSRLTVVANGRLVGILALKELLDLFALRIDLEGED